MSTNTESIKEQEGYILQLENIIRTLNYYGEHDRKNFYEKKLIEHKAIFSKLLRDRKAIN